MKVVLIDEDKYALDHLAFQLNQFTSLDVIGMYTDPLLGIEVVKMREVNFVFLAIESLKGIKIANQISYYKPSVPIIWINPCGEYAVKAFEYNAFDYLLKPIRKERLQATIERMLQGKFPERLQTPEVYLQVDLFGQLSIVKHTNNETESLQLRWRTRKAEQLFFLLLLHQGNMMEKEKIIEMLWPNSELDRAYEQLYVAIYHIRQALKAVVNHLTISSRLNCYELKLNKVKLDTGQFEQLSKELIPQSTENITKYETALVMNHGPLLRNHDYIWLEALRQTYEREWLQIARHVLDYYEKNDASHRGIHLATLVCERFPYEEIGYFYLMKYHAQLGHQASVQGIYNDLVQMTWEELQVYPTEKVMEWYDEWIVNNCLLLNESLSIG